jgi:hypothetical protein
LLILFLVLSMFAFMADPAFASALTILIFFMWAGHGLSLQWIPVSARFVTLFDRPFLVIVFYIPATLFMWCGLEGGIRLSLDEKYGYLQRWLSVGVLILGLINTLFIQNHHPSDCCVFLNDDDLFSFEWMKQHLPEDALVGIAATGEPGNYLPADGGAWIEHFTGIATRRLDSSKGFINETATLCAEGISYFYLDGLENSFDEYNLWEAGGIYQFGMGDVKIYHLNCDAISQNNPNP